MTTTRQLTPSEASKLAQRLLCDCIVTAVSTLSATFLVEITRRNEIGGLPSSLRLQAFASPTSSDSSRIQKAFADLFRDMALSTENVETMSAALLLTALKESASLVTAARVDADGTLEMSFSSAIGVMRIPILGSAEDELSWILDVPRGIAGEGQSLTASGDGSRLESSFP